MGGKLDYRWHLRKVMADRGMFSTTDLIPLLADRGIALSSSQVYRLVVERPERLSLKILMALLDILDCTMDDLIEPVAAPGAAQRPGKAAAGGRRTPQASVPCARSEPGSPGRRRDRQLRQASFG
jgi:DNA-binding Xre family transcriptional regulator